MKIIARTLNTITIAMIILAIILLLELLFLFLGFRLSLISYLSAIGAFILFYNLTSVFENKLLMVLNMGISLFVWYVQIHLFILELLTVIYPVYCLIISVFILACNKSIIDEIIILKGAKINKTTNIRHILRL